jgi:hypothetical protein
MQDEFYPLMMRQKMFPQSGMMQSFSDEMGTTRGAVLATTTQHMIVPSNARNQMFGNWFFVGQVVVIGFVIPTVGNGTAIATE